jgi:hypothetical protein
MNIKKRFLILCFFLGTLTASQAQSNDATVYFMRYTGYQGSAISFTTFIDGQLVCKLNNKSFSTHKVTEGKHTFAVQFAGKEAKEKAELITINVEAGKTYYIQLILQNGLWVNNLYCQEVTESSAQTIFPKLKEDKKCM